MSRLHEPTQGFQNNDVLQGACFQKVVLEPGIKPRIHDAVMWIIVHAKLSNLTKCLSGAYDVEAEAVWQVDATRIEAERPVRVVLGLRGARLRPNDTALRRVSCPLNPLDLSTLYKRTTVLDVLKTPAWGVNGQERELGRQNQVQLSC